VQIKMLNKAHYVEIKKEFKNNKSQTTVTITDIGIISLKQYIKDMETIIREASE